MERFSLADPNEPTQRRLRSPPLPNNLQSALINKLQRQNLYLKNQLYAMVQNSGVYDMYLPSEEMLREQYLKNDRFGSPQTHRPQIPDIIISSNQNRQSECTARRYCLSPRIASVYLNHDDQFTRTRSPQLHPPHRLTFNHPINHRKMRQTCGLDNFCGPIRSHNNSPSRVTPKESNIFTVQPSEARLNFRDMNSYNQGKQKMAELKRNVKSPSFLKNKLLFKQNVKQSLSHIQKGLNLHTGSHQPLEQQVQLGKDSRGQSKAQLIETGQKRGSHQRSKSKTLTFECSGDSSISIQRRLREILCQSIPNHSFK